MRGMGRGSDLSRDCVKAEGVKEPEILEKNSQKDMMGTGTKRKEGGVLRKVSTLHD